jgi:hypothetical protein
MQIPPKNTLSTTLLHSVPCVTKAKKQIHSPPKTNAPCCFDNKQPSQHSYPPYNIQMAKLTMKLRHSRRPGKKYDAIFICLDGSHITTSFGATGYSDFTKHKDTTRKQRYIIRHARREHWNDPTTPGSLSRWILWNKPTVRASLADFKKRFRLK